VSGTRTSLHGAIQTWWKRERSISSRLRSLRLLAGILLEFLRDSQPERKRQRYGDIDYDWEYRVDTTGATVSWRTRLMGLLNSPYQPIEPELFREMMNSLKIDFPQFTFIDIGSGKGRALLLASEYPFGRILGLEILPELNEVAIENIREFAGREKKIPKIQAICADATKFEFPVDPLVVLLFNPLPEASLKIMIQNLEKSLQDHPRPVHLLYANPVLAAVPDGSSLFQRGSANHRYCTFSTKVHAASESPEP